MAPSSPLQGQRYNNLSMYYIHSLRCSSSLKLTAHKLDQAVPTPGILRTAADTLQCIQYTVHCRYYVNTFVYCSDFGVGGVLIPTVELGDMYLSCLTMAARNSLESITGTTTAAAGEQAWGGTAMRPINFPGVCLCAYGSTC
jgi:hypothetical protein